jgi:hypothetical protein
MNEVAVLKIKSSIRECEAHLRQLSRCMSFLREFFPLTVPEFSSLGDERIEHIDQFIFRFSKFQDALGLRFFPALYSLLENDDGPRPFLDILARMESYGALKDLSQWQYFRNLRNNFAHDYPESAETTVSALNSLYEKWSGFVDIYRTARAFLESRQDLAGLTR